MAYEQYIINELEDTFSELADIPTMDATQLKNWFDRSPIQLKNAINAFVTAVGADKDLSDAWKAELEALNLDEDTAASLAANLIHHKERHSAGGGDEITTDDIGAEKERLVFPNTAVTTSGWATFTASGAEETAIIALGYSYRKTLTLANVTETMDLEIDPYADYAACGAVLYRGCTPISGGANIYANVIPTTAFTVHVTAWFEPLANAINRTDVVASRDGNIYVYPDHYIDNKYADVSGEIKTASGWGCAKIPVEPQTTYSIMLPYGIYTGALGAICYYNGTTPVSKQSFDTSLSGTKLEYDGTKYITVTTPAGINYLAITCKKASVFDNSATLVVVKGKSVSGKTIARKLRSVKSIETDDGVGVYRDKKLVVIGDSLTEFNLRATKNYHHYISDELGLAVYNMGKSGSGYMALQGSSNAFYQRALSVPNDANAIIIFGSGNDMASPLGSPSDTGTTTICGCVNATLDNIFSVLPTVPVGIITPTPWQSYNPSLSGNLMELYSDALIAICKRRGIPCLDLYRNSGLRPWDAAYRLLMYSRDDGAGTHPDENGHKLIYPIIREFLKTLI